MNLKIRNASIILFALLCIVAVSCKDNNDDFTHVTAMEQEIHNLVNEFRDSVGLNELVLNYSMVKEAQGNSSDWASGNDPSTGLTDRFQSVIDKFGGSNPQAILSSWSAGLVTSQMIVDSWKNDSSLVSILKGEYTQSGPGVAKDSEGKLYVTHLFLNISSK